MYISFVEIPVLTLGMELKTLKLTMILMVLPDVITFSIVSLSSETLDHSLLRESAFNFGVPHVMGEDFRLLLDGTVPFKW